MAEMPIASLDPSLPIPSSQSITAIVTLIWPYSSTTKHCALLLADPDFRLRYSKGQIRARFQGQCGRALANLHVGIGDELRLDLDGARWLEGNTNSTTRTPGKSVDGELVFGRSLRVWIHKEGKEPQVLEVNASTPPASPLRNNAVPATPAPQPPLRSSLDAGGLAAMGIYSSPAYMKRLRLSQGSYIESPALTDFDTSLFGESPRKRRRVSYKNVSEWKYAGDVPQSEALVADDVDLITTTGARQEESEKTLPDDQSANTIGTSASEVREQSGLSSPVSEVVDLREPSGPGLSTEISRPDPIPGGEDSFAQPLTISSEEPSRASTPATSQEISSMQAAQQSTQEASVSSTDIVPTASPMRPPPLPLLQMPAPTQIESGPRTPVLGPVTPSKLPLLSPFPQTPLASISPSMVSFPGLQGPAAEQMLQSEDAIATTAGIADSEHLFEQQQEQARSEIHALHEPQEQAPGDSTFSPAKQSSNRNENRQPAADAALSPSSGSEADVSSDDEYDIDELERLQDDQDSFSDNVEDELEIDIKDQDVRREIDENELLYREADDVLERQSDSSPLVHESDSASVASLSDRSDDESEGAGTFEPRSALADPDEAIMSDPDSEAYDADIRPVLAVDEADMKSPPTSANGSYEFGLDGSMFSKEPGEVVEPIVGTAAGSNDVVADVQAVTEHSANSDAVASSQDDDAAWVARDEAFHDLHDQGLEDEQPDVFAEALHKPPAFIESISDEALTVIPSVEQHDHPEQATVQEVDEVASVSSPRPLEFGTGEQGHPVADHSLDIGSTSQKKPPSIEEVDLTQVEPDYMDIFLRSQPMPQSTRPPTIPDSVQSRATTLVPDESRPVSKDREHDLSSNFARLLPSQELGMALSAVEAGRLAREVEPLPTVLEEHGRFQDVDDGALDDSLLEDFVDHDAYVSIPPQHEPSSEDELAGPVKYSTNTEVKDGFKVKDDSLQQTKFDKEAHTDPLVLQTPDHPQLHDGMPSATKMSTTRSSRKSLHELLVAQKSASRASDASEALSDWFTPRNSEGRHHQLNEHTPTESDSPSRPPPATAPAKAFHKSRLQHSQQQRSISPPVLRRYTQSQGLTTDLSYFHPLTNLEMHLNSPSAIVDILAVVNTLATDPIRAKSGPRDWYTYFHITDPDLYEQETNLLVDRRVKSDKDQEDDEESVSDFRHDTRVEVFRPWKASLPSASPGDVILLRSFGVKSRSRHPYLLSSEASAWCVWRYQAQDSASESNDAEQPAWSRSLSSGARPREEIKGPPVDIGGEERRKAEELRSWWELVAFTEAKDREKLAKGKGKAVMGSQADDGRQRNKL